MALLLWLVAPVGVARAITLDLPLTARLSVGKSETLTSYAVPIGPFSNGAIPTRRVEGALQQTAWRVESPGATTLELLAPLRAQVIAAGFRPLLDCDHAECGGFDFRYGTAVLPEPEMHVDLGDYRFFAAERGAEVISLIVSRTAVAGFVQMIHVGGAGPDPVLTASTKASPAPIAALAPPNGDAAAAPSDLGARLLAEGAVTLDDLVFASGTSSLSDTDYPSLRALAKVLQDKPDLTIAFVGHTDASGGLEGNITLSRQRADAARAVLLSAYGVAADRVDARGVGYLAPRASNLTEAGREKNRRVEVIVTSTR